jgi:ATP-binding cassette subfamily B protein
LKDPRILILDEATSSVDTETEAQIQEALEELVKGRTTFAIAHRLSTLKHAHRLVVLEKGTLVEMGTHDELVAKGGTYARLCKMQTELSRIRAW